jgi:F0F1-type ATP synthase assembly protein I
MATPNGGRRSPIAVAMEMASQITSAALMMALPPGVGYWVDLKLGTSPWFLVAGAALGLTVGMTQLLRVANGTKKKLQKDKQQSDDGQH